MMYLRHPKRRTTLQVLLIWACFMIPVSAMLYGTSASVREKESELSSINAQIEAEKDSLRVLRAEWAYLNQPQKLASRVQKYLTPRKAAAPAQVLAENQMTVKVGYRPALAPALAANTVPIEPTPQDSTPHLLAKPIVFNEHALAALHDRGDAKLPSSATWSQKVVSAFGLSSAMPSKSRMAP